MSPLGALIVHFNTSSKSVRRAFSKMIEDTMEKERQKLLQAKVAAGVKSIQDGKGVSRHADETTAQFFDRLCTE